MSSPFRLVAVAIGTLAAGAAAGATPDGFTLLLGSVGPLAVHQFTYPALPFDPKKDFAPVALLESSPILSRHGRISP